MSIGKSPVKFFAGRESKYIAEKIAQKFGSELGKSTVTVFSDGEFQPSFEETVRGCKVFIIQSTFPPVENLMELLLMADAAKRASAHEVIAVVPYFGWARQDRKDKPRVSIGAKLVADMLNVSGIDRIMTMDLHADQIQGFFNMHVDHIYASTIFVPYVKSLNLSDMVVAAPDMGGTKRANAYSRFLGTEMAICYKLRKQANVIEHITVIGEIENKNVIIVDDMIDTAGTICLASEMMLNKGAKSVRVVATHPVFSGKAYERINNSVITEVIVSDSIPLKQQSPKIKVITIADLFADIINKVYNYQSISSNFIV